MLKVLPTEMAVLRAIGSWFDETKLKRLIFFKKQLKSHELDMSIRLQL